MDALRDGPCIGMIAADSKRATVGAMIILCVLMGDLSGIVLLHEPCAAVKMVIQATLYFTMNGRYRAMQIGRDGAIGRTGVE